MADLLERIARAQRPPFHLQSVPEARASYTAAAEVLEPPRAALARVQALRVAGGDGAMLDARLYAPSDAMLPVLLYLHGGGFTIGNLETHDSLCRQLALRSGAAIVALDYRLAPEHRFPAAVDDAWAALQWLAVHAETLGLDRTRLAIGGDSAGATLATVAAIQARDAGLPLRLQVLITPGTAADGRAYASRAAYAHGYLLEDETIEWFFDQYIDRAQRSDWRYAPLEAEDLDGVAPDCVLLAECDPLVDEGLAYVDRLRSAGVDVALELVRGMTHDFIKLGRVLPEAADAQAFIAARIAQAFAT